jgi:hypothetical protein
VPRRKKGRLEAFRGRSVIGCNRGGGGASAARKAGAGDQPNPRSVASGKSQRTVGNALHAGLHLKENPGRGGRGFRGGRAKGENSIVRKISSSITQRSSRLIPFLAQTGPSRRGNRFDQARIVIPDIADARAHRPGDHAVGRVGGEQRLQIRQRPPAARRAMPARPRASGSPASG